MSPINTSLTRTKWHEATNSRPVCVISGLYREKDENCALLGCYAGSSGNSLPKFRDSISFPSSGLAA